jgi:hypothetical protein
MRIAHKQGNMDHSPDSGVAVDEAHRRIVTDGGERDPNPSTANDGAGGGDAAGDEDSDGEDTDTSASTTLGDVQRVRERVKSTGGNVGFDSASGDWIDDADEETDQDDSSVSRRRVVGYLGGTMAGVFGLAGAGWYAFFRNTNEPEEQVVIDYWDYIDRAKYNSAVAIFHRNAPVEPITPETVAMYSQASIDVESTEILDRRGDVDFPGVLTLALVRVEISLDWRTSTDRMNLAFAVAENEENNWRIWDDSRNNDDEN